MDDAARLATLASYLPRSVQRDVAEHALELETAHVEPSQGALLLVDISGFTALTADAVRRGPAGIEALSRSLNLQLGAIIELIAEHGGEIDKIVGDALLPVWRATDEDLPTTAHRAAACGLAILGQVGGLALEGDARLPLNVGLCAGDVSTMHVGGVADRWLHLVAGDAPSQLAALEPSMRSGAMVASPEAWALIGDGFTGEPLEAARVRVIAERIPLAPRAVTTVELHPGDERRLRRYAPAVALPRLDAGQGDWLAELRTTTVVFANVHGSAETTPDAIERLQHVTEAAQRIVARFDGWLKEITIDDKGTTLVAAFGVPPFSHEDDPDRAVRAALGFQTEIRSLGLTAGIGIATGPAFCGPVGNARRRDFVVLGQHVNLAARLMGASGRDVVLCDAPTRLGTRGEAAFQRLPAYVLKGMATPIDVYRTRPPRSSADRPAGLIDRTAERAAATSALDALVAGAGGLVVLEGEPGIGKSRLVDEWLRLAGERRVRALVGAAVEIEASTPYQAWRAVFEQLLGLAAVTDRATRRAVVAERLRGDPESLRLAPLLDAVLSLDLADDADTAQLSGVVRADNTRDLLIRILAQEAAASPLMVILEDAHWLDSASWALVLRAQREIPNLLLVITTRPTGDAAADPVAMLGDGVTTLRIAGLSREDTLALACERTGATRITEPVAAIVLERAEGNPLFIEQLTFAMRDTGRIVVEDGTVRTMGADRLDGSLIPDTVQRVITTRLDQLPPGESLTLKVASVIGQRFTPETLAEIYPIPIDAATLAEHLETLTRLDLVAPMSTPAGPEYTFRHVITQEVAYKVMLPAQSKQLHRRLAELTERANAADLSPYHAFLAHHWRQAGEPSRAMDHLGMAGEQALRTFANEEAVAFLEGALALADEAGLDVEPVRLARWRLEIGEAYVHLSRYREGRPHLETGLRLLDRPVPATTGRQTLALLREVGVQILRRLHLDRGIRRLTGDAAHDRISVLRAYERLAEVSYYAAETLLPLYCVIRILNEAEASGDPAEIARGMAGTGALFGVIPLARIASWYLRRAQERLAAVDDLTTHEIVGVVIGFYELGTGAWEAARARFETVRDIAGRLGDRRRFDDAVGNLMELELLHGSFLEAAALAGPLVSAAEARNDLRFAAEGLLGQAHAAIRLGDFETVGRSLERLRAILSTGTELTDEVRIKAAGLESVIHLRRGEMPEAMAAAERTMHLTEGQRPSYFGTMLGYVGPAEVYLAAWEANPGPGSPVAEAKEALGRLRSFARVFPIGRPRSLTLRGRQQWLLGRHEAAHRSWRDALAHAGALAMPYEAGLAHAALGAHLDVGDPERATHLAAAREIFTRLRAAPALANLERAEVAGNEGRDV